MESILIEITRLQLYFGWTPPLMLSLEFAKIAVFEQPKQIIPSIVSDKILSAIIRW